MIEATNILNSMRPLDMYAFKKAAKWHNCYILVRRTNSASKQYIGRPGYVAKPFDAKFKTADMDFIHTGLQKRLKVAGLVVNPEMDAEFRKAFKPQKYHKAVEIWRTDHHKVVYDIPTHDASGQPNYHYISKPYCVNSDAGSEHYGCLLFAKSSPITGAKFIHSDYDLYGIVPADNPSSNVLVQEKLLGQDHSRGPQFYDVQNYVNSHMGVPMVLHASQEKYKLDLDDAIDVFYPNGDIKLFSGLLEIKSLYEVEFGGRKIFTKNAELKTVLGRYVEVV